MYALLVQKGIIFKRFKEKENFIKIINNFRVRKSTMIFKINIVKLGDKYERMKNSLLSLNFTKAISRPSKKYVRRTLVNFNR